jgi:hypothetical protein
MLRALLRGATALAFTAALGAQVPTTSPAPDALSQRPENVTISLMTMATSGRNVWEMFGHNALWIHDNVTGRDTVFNWGAFDFTQPNFIPRFLMGRMWYAMAGDSLGHILLAYGPRYMNRSVYAQELDLTTAEKDSVLKQVRWYARPENVNYRYDFFLDNCSTRIRDIIDNALHGQLRPKADSLTGTTYRWHALRLMQSNKPLVLGVNIGLGRMADRELTRWQAMFLPRQLHDFAAGVQIRDSAGGMRPLVRGERILYQDTRGPEYDKPPMMLLWLFVGGLAFGGLFAWLGVRAPASRGARRSAAVLAGVWSLVVGFLGVLVTLLWTVTDHVSAHYNENFLLFNPVWLILAWPLAASLWKGRSGVWTQRLAMTVAALAGAALLMHIVRISRQDNLALVLLVLPPALAMSWIAARIRSTESPAAQHSAAAR